MGAPAYLSTDAAARRAAETSEMHKASVDEYAARKGACAQVHLPTGRMCTCRTVTGGRATSSQPTRRTRPFLLTGPTAGKGHLMTKTGRATTKHVTPYAWVPMDASGRIRFVSRQAELLFG
jgi:hypothetical protein